MYGGEHRSQQRYPTKRSTSAPGRPGGSACSTRPSGPTFGTDLVRGVIAGGPAALTEAIEGAEHAFDPADLADLTAADALAGR